MKKRFFLVGISILFLSTVAIGVLFVGRNNTLETVSTETNAMDTIIAMYPPEEQDDIREYYEEQRQKAKATGNEEFVTRFQKVLQELLREDVDDPIPDDYREAAQYYDAKIQKEKAAGASGNYYIATLEYLRDMQLSLARSKEEIERQHQADRARYDALRTPEEKLAYYEEELKENEEWLRRATAAGDAGWIKFAQMHIESVQGTIEYYKRQIVWDSKKRALDAQLQRVDALVDRYRHLLHIEVVDGVEKVVGIRTPDEIVSSPSEKATPAESLPPLPVMSDDVSSSPPAVANTHIPHPAGLMEYILKARTQFESWRKAIDTDYVDVLVSQYMTPQEINQYFPTDQARQELANRTEKLQSEVAANIRKLVSQFADTTSQQKQAVARDLLTENFDGDFAESVLKHLVFDDN